MLHDIRQLHPQIFVLPHPTGLKPTQPIVQIVLGVVAFPRRGYHHHVDRVRRVKRGERFMTPFDEDVPQRVGDSGIIISATIVMGMIVYPHIVDWRYHPMLVIVS